MAIKGTAYAAFRAKVFEDIFDRFWSPILHHIECSIDDDDEASLVASAVFELAWKKLDTSHPLGLIWLLRAADNKIRDHQRRQLAQAKAVASLQHRASLGRPSDPLDHIAVRNAVATVLNARERRVVVLYYWDQLSAGEVAAVLSCSPAAVWTALSRARTKLNRALDQDDEGASAPTPGVGSGPIAQVANSLQVNTSAFWILPLLSGSP